MVKESFKSFFAFTLLFIGIPVFAQSSSMIIGHRGMGIDHSPEPENSIPGLVLALQKGASAVEFDVQLTSDNRLVLAHDEVLDRMTDGTGCVATHSLSELQVLHLKDGNQTVHLEDQVATLEEALIALKPLAPLMFIHIKVYDGLHGDVAGFHPECPATKYLISAFEVLDLVRTMNLLDHVLFISFDPRVLNEIQKLEPKAKTGLLSYFSPAYSTDIAVESHYNAVIFNNDKATHEDIASAHASGLRAFLWFPDEETNNDLNCALGDTDGIITNQLDTALSLEASVRSNGVSAQCKYSNSRDLGF